MYIELTEKRVLSAKLSGITLHGLEIESEWNGLTKLIHPETGVYLIVMRDVGMIVDGTPSVIEQLLAPVASTGYLQFPRTTLPCGLVVEPFQVAQYMNYIDKDGKAYVSETEKPHVRINFHDSRKACRAAGGDLINGSQHLALALDIVNQDANWTGGKVGQGHVYRGLHKASVSGAQANDFVSHDSLERRWHVLSTGDRIYDFAGHLYSWMVNDLPGNDNGLAGKIAVDSPYLTTGSKFTYEQGMGYRPDGARDWSGYALIRGGYWYSSGDAGVFSLDGGSPDCERDGVGFRCTKSVS